MIRVSNGGGRREGKSTVFIDVAIMNALNGERVWFQHTNFQDADHNFGMATGRLHRTGLASRFTTHVGSLTLRVRDSEGEITFTAQDPAWALGGADARNRIVVSDLNAAIGGIWIPIRLLDGSR